MGRRISVREFTTLGGHTIGVTHDGGLVLYRKQHWLRLKLAHGRKNSIKSVLEAPPLAPEEPAPTKVRELAS